MHVTGCQVLHQRFVIPVFRDDVEVRGRITGDFAAEVAGEREIDSVVSSLLQTNDLD